MLVTRSNFEQAVDHLTKQEALALDTETTGLRPFHGDTLFSIIIADALNSFYFNFGEYAGLEPDKILDTRHMHELNKRVLQADSDRLWMFHHYKFDAHMLATKGLGIKGHIHDTKVNARILYDDHMSYSLDACAGRIGLKKSDAVKEYIEEHELWDWVEVPGKKTREKAMYFNQVPFDVIAPYGEVDARITYDLGHRQLQDLRTADEGAAIAHHQPFKNLVSNESRLMHVVFHMEQTGLLVDLPYCAAALRYETGRMEAAEAVWQGLTGEPFQDTKAILSRHLPIIKTTDKGNICFDYAALQSLKDVPAAAAVLAWRDAKKRLDFFHTFRHHADTASRIHTNLDQAGTRTGRFCVAKGTLIDVVRDVSKEPKGRPIESIVPGDFVYCYDSKLELRLKKVLWQGKTGHKKTLRLHWMGQGRKHYGHLDVTSEHLIRLSDGRYIQAKDLRKNDSMLALGRSKVLGYSRLHCRDKEIREHRFIYAQLRRPPTATEHVHHLDENKLNNRIENLECLEGTEHTRRHALVFSNQPEAKLRSSAQLKALWKSGKMVARSGPEAGNYIATSRFALLRELARAGGRPTRCKTITRDFDTFKKKCRDNGLDILSVAKRYDAEGKFISRGRMRAVEEFRPSSRHEHLRIGFYRYREILKYYSNISNHIVTYVEEIAAPVDVYDLEVEDCHNFIANEICVHNSSNSPNLQQITSSEEINAPFPVRRAFRPTPDFSFFMFDYDQQEYRLMLDYAGIYAREQKLIELVKGGLDVHQATADVARISRAEAKAVNFAIIFGAGNDLLAENLHRSYGEAAEIRAAVLGAAPEIEQFLYNVKARAAARGYVVNWFGRRWQCPLRKLSYKAPNYICQGGGADVIKVAMVRIDQLLRGRGALSRIVLQVHDEIVMEIHHSERHLVAEIRAIMEGVYPHRFLPLTVGVEYSDVSFADGKKWTS